ncbi:MAG: PD-(D/E)XK nuclease family protein [Armatimonadetes bacterium]|nr:PD-(D/E)XK nuclease family protein [Armatimonadota bacterium]
MGRLVNEFTWSFSRDRALRQCPRAYYYRYYGSWDGWHEDAPAAVRRMYALKKLTSLHGWAGQVVEWTLLTALHQARAGGQADLGYLRRLAAGKLKSDWRLSQYNIHAGGPSSFRIQEHHYAQIDARLQPDQLAPAIQEKVRTAVSHFASSGLLERLCRVSGEDWLHCPPPASRQGPPALPDHLTLDGVKIWIAMDLADREAGGIHIRDWKTGRVHSDDQAQLACYALYALNRWPEASLDRIRTTAVYLSLPGPWEPTIPTPAMLAATREAIQTSVRHMRSLLTDPEKNTAEIACFPVTGDARMCRFCNFRALCPEGHKRMMAAPAPEPEEEDPLAEEEVG